MLGAKKSRGATAIPKRRGFSRGHLLLVAFVSIGSIAAVSLMPSQDVEANKHPELSAPVSTLTQIEPTIPEVHTETFVPIEPPWTDYQVKNGDNLSLIFKRAGYTDGDIYSITEHAKQGKSLTRIFPGQTISFQANTQGQLIGLKHVISALETTRFTKTEDGFESSKDIRTPQAPEAWAHATITSSLFIAGQEAGLSHNMIMEMANIFGGVIDFILDPRKGDTIHLLYEELYLDGEKYGDGKILAASFTNRGKTFNAFRYEDSQGESNYYNEEGVSMRKAFLLAPLDFSRISSNFNPRRLHPIYKTKRPHRGTDYAASRGTPVFAAGDGRVQKAGYSRANGNYIFIAHGEAYVTRYLHLHKRHVKRGQRVSQSQIIGTVGSTGAATGSHLHYEFLVNGVHRNPRTIHKQLPKAKTLDDTEMPRFNIAIANRSMTLAALQAEENLALNNQPSSGPE